MINRKILLKRQKELKYSTNKIALLADLGYATVYDILSGKLKNPKIETVIKLCRTLHLSIDQIII